MSSTSELPASKLETLPHFWGKFRDRLSVLFFAVLFFLCSADQFFTTRLAGFNFRWGQPLLLVAGLLALRHHWAGPRNRSPESNLLGKISKFWCLFFGVYGLTALLSDNPGVTLIKWGWGFFNIGLAAFVLLDRHWGDSLSKGITAGATAVALTVWAQAIALYWLGATPHPADWQFTCPVLIQGLPFPLGYVQPGPNFNTMPILRLDAFYYEPSYAGCALAFAFPLVLAYQVRSGPNRFPWAPSLILSSIFLVGSRSGILSVLLGMAAFGIYGAFKSITGAKSLFWKTMVAALLALVFFCLASGARWYMAFNLGLFKDRFNYAQLTKPKSSERGRMASILGAFQLWRQHPMLGNGVPPSASTDKRLDATTEDMWLEIATESGWVGLMAFGIALGGTIWTAWARGIPSPLQGLVLSAWISHLVVNLNLCETFPRLDFWLLFFFAVRLLAFSIP